MSTVWLPVMLEEFSQIRQPIQHTPARTLVMSRMRRPANGRVGELEGDVAKPLRKDDVEALKLVSFLKLLVRRKII